VDKFNLDFKLVDKNEENYKKVVEIYAVANYVRFNMY